MSDDSRFDRLISVDESGDDRHPAERDRDRILNSSALHRLAGVTQVVGAAEGVIFHNRLTHTLEVAQIGRRLAERLIRHQGEFANLTGLNADVVETAALAHDLGHPPFGHVAEDELNRLAVTHGATDGFEGNAQSFRILVRLAAHRTGYQGLNLTRATLNAVLKYPWLRDIVNNTDANKKYRKFGAYRSDEHAFRFARETMGDSDRQCIEAQIMDVADEIAYSVYDLDDFFRAGLIPLGVLEFSSYFERWINRSRVDRVYAEERRDSLKGLLETLKSEEEYRGDFIQRAERQEITSILIGQFANSISLIEQDGSIVIDIAPDKKLEMQFLQGLVWEYVILNSRLATQQRGLRQIISTLFTIYFEAIQHGQRELVPRQFYTDLEALNTATTPTEDSVRLAVDIVASFADEQAITMYRRLMGVTPGSVAEILHG